MDSSFSYAVLSIYSAESIYDKHTFTAVYFARISPTLLPCFQLSLCLPPLAIILPVIILPVMPPLNLACQHLLKLRVSTHLDLQIQSIH